MIRHSLAGRLRPAVWFYVASAACLAVGATVGGLMATGIGHHMHESLHAAHVHANIFGWLGLAVLGTLLMLWPAALRVQMHEAAPARGRRIAWVAAVSLGVQVAGFLLGLRWVAVAGGAGYLAAVVDVAVLGAQTVVVRRPGRPSLAAAVPLGSAVVWLAVVLVLDLVRIATTGDGTLDRVVPALLAGFVAQVVTGALTFLLPPVLGRGPAGMKRILATLERGWQVRVALTNAGALALLLPLPHAWHVAAVAVAYAGPGLLVPAILAAGVSSLLGREGGPVLGVREIVGSSAIATVLAVLVLSMTGVLPVQHPVAVPAGSVVLDVRLSEFTIQPGVLSVPAGRPVALRVHNVGEQTHDLRVSGHGRTPSLSPGESAVLPLGVVSAPLDGWCTIAGHRADGMSMRIVPSGATPGSAASSAAGSTAGSAGGGMAGMPGMSHDGPAVGPADSATPAPPSAAAVNAALAPGAHPAAGWTPYDATLPPVGEGTVHAVTLHVVEGTVEVAPGIRQRVWTFGGSVPGPVLHGRLGDTFHVTVVNDAPMTHSIDFHAGEVAPDAVMRPIPPGGRLEYTFRADHAGIWMYHCGTAPAAEHVAAGMYGAVVIDPPGLPAVAHEYVMVAGEVHLSGPDTVAPMSMVAQRPDLMVFNGYAKQYVDAPLAVRAGDRVRVWVLDAGPDEPLSFHVIGAQFDRVYKEGAYLLSGGAGAAQVLDLQAGEGGFVETRLPSAGHYPFVSHLLVDAARGAMGEFDVR